MRPTELMPKQLIDFLLTLYKLDPKWIGPVKNGAVRSDGRTGFSLDPVENLTKAAGTNAMNNMFVQLMIADGARSVMTYYGNSVWLGQGPKVFKVSPQQEEVMENIEVNIAIRDYCQPYPAMLIPLNRNSKFRAILVHHDPSVPYVSATLFARDRVLQDGDTIIVMGVDGPEGMLETALRKYDADCADSRIESEQACRVALNSCLALTHYDNRTDYLFPKEVESDRKLARERSDRGDRARSRLAMAVHVVSFSREVKLHRTESRKRSEGTPTGRQMGTHWRSGHWRMQPHGPNNSLRRRIFIAPVLVREDLFVGDKANTQTTYVGGKP